MEIDKLLKSAEISIRLYKDLLSKKDEEIKSLKDYVKNLNVSNDLLLKDIDAKEELLEDSYILNKDLMKQIKEYKEQYILIKNPFKR